MLPKIARPAFLLFAGSTSAEDLHLVPAAIERYEIETQTRSHANFSAEQKADAFATSDVLLSPVVNTQETFGLSLDEP